MEFKGKTAVVTGSSGGIGKAVAIALAKEGADVVLASRNVQGMEEAAQEIRAAGQKALVVRMDVGNDADVWAMKDKALAEFGHIDVLINNAAVGVRGYVQNVSMENWSYIINTNLLGYIRVLEAFLPHYLERKSGYIVNVSSIQGLGFTPEPLAIPYITTKAGILGLTESMYGYLGPMGIKMSCLIPGAIFTNISTNSRFVGATDKEVEELKAREAEFFKLPIFLSSEQLAEGLLEGMKREDYLILVPENMKQMLMPQGRNVDMLNEYIKEAVKPENAGRRMGPPPPRD